ncbi:hypothetical protein HQ305_08775 [Rhodococcus sp. BP-149]|uniref:hypothetical protein n=1 Tax=unclassified Rhodococcus (in: high G+C Gram-positive bacteria) TaxID=192944 RepID=UPI001C9B0624|nr:MULTISPECIES: hypothetical protein [unclassified Rhodococcus (in: high G+C Gram-positive bacteria)]MBY6686173.1 hypothetical protein [Rhodococcus sp. BP-288]MBY6693737.1 hypothetical protein [Rhodococcus sp. BP-188]MBY6699666.1 hypothetical protein [Rhodococcus sp. BP-285]MBY6703989.1 hypothetical protein [Rhodococcus sp. BP-283]MBY6710862.1 hypothetical protein [Rhodococcus sp. BP-160]
MIIHTAPNAVTASPIDGRGNLRPQALLGQPAGEQRSQSSEGAQEDRPDEQAVQIEHAGHREQRRTDRE